MGQDALCPGGSPGSGSGPGLPAPLTALLMLGTSQGRKAPRRGAPQFGGGLASSRFWLRSFVINEGTVSFKLMLVT